MLAALTPPFWVGAGDQKARPPAPGVCEGQVLFLEAGVQGQEEIEDSR